MADTNIDALRFVGEEIERLRKERERTDREWHARMAVLKGQLERLSAMNSEPAKSNGSSTSYTITSFKGMEVPTAVEIYMRARRNKEGVQKISFAEILRDLREGGVQLDKYDPDFIERSIMASGRNRRLYEYNRDDRVMWMASSADDTPPKQSRGKPKPSKLK
jgi:hypothetical protein